MIRSVLCYNEREKEIINYTGTFCVWHKFVLNTRPIRYTTEWHANSDSIVYRVRLYTFCTFFVFLYKFLCVCVQLNVLFVHYSSILVYHLTDCTELGKHSISSLIEVKQCN